MPHDGLILIRGLFSQKKGIFSKTWEKEATLKWFAEIVSTINYSIILYFNNIIFSKNFVWGTDRMIL